MAEKREFSSQAGLAGLRHGVQVTLTPHNVRGMVPRDGEQAHKTGGRTVPPQRYVELTDYGTGAQEFVRIEDVRDTLLMWFIDPTEADLDAIDEVQRRLLYGEEFTEQAEHLNLHAVVWGD